MGVITFDVRGKVGTPADKPTGDTTIVAKDGGAEVGSVKVIVVIPIIHERSSSEIKYTNGAELIKDKPGTTIRSNASRIVTITVRDQFRDVLDSVYDGNKVVHEIFFDPTGDWKDNLMPEDLGNPLAIEFPDADSKSGVKKDEHAVEKFRSIDQTLTGPQRDAWAKFSILVKIPGKDPMGFNNTYAVRLDIGDPDHAKSTVLQAIQVHGHDTKFKVGGAEHNKALRERTQAKKLLMIPLGMPGTPITMEDKAP